MSETEKSVFEVLSAINVNDKVEQKNGLTYLSWAWAWAADAWAAAAWVTGLDKEALPLSSSSVNSSSEVANRLPQGVAVPSASMVNAVTVYSTLP